MFYPSSLKRAVFLSLLSHLVVFTLFNLSFGKRLPKQEHVPVFFWGELLSYAQVSPPPYPALPAKYLKRLKEFSLQRTDSLALDTAPALSQPFFKPPLSLAFSQEKETFLQHPLRELSFQKKKKEPSIIFHPLLPYSFTLYFKDRQIAHVELMFKIISSSHFKNSILIKRKISSGNLEVDLLTMRYIGHYLFIQQAKFMPNVWQTVKIDLSAKER